MTKDTHIHMYVKLADLVIGAVYELEARNIRCGMWTGEAEGFTGRRMKFGNIYMDHELHYDSDERHGTAKAIRMLVDDEGHMYPTLRDVQ